MKDTRREALSLQKKLATICTLYYSYPSSKILHYVDLSHLPYSVLVLRM